MHGEAVAIGMMMAFDLSAQIGLCPIEDTTRVGTHLKAVGLPVQPTDIVDQKWDRVALLGHMAQDKKVRDGKITFILTRGIGEAFITSDVDISDVEALLDKAIAA